MDESPHKGGSINLCVCVCVLKHKEGLQASSRTGKRQGTTDGQRGEEKPDGELGQNIAQPHRNVSKRIQQHPSVTQLLIIHNSVSLRCLPCFPILRDSKTIFVEKFIQKKKKVCAYFIFILFVYLLFIFIPTRSWEVVITLVKMENH